MVVAVAVVVAVIVAVCVVLCCVVVIGCMDIFMDSNQET